jgi:predicted MFS family arabinose efflux permease
VFAISAAAFSRIPLLPEIGADLSLTVGEIGLLTTAFGVGRLVMDLPAGRMAAAVPPAFAFVAAGAGLAAASALRRCRSPRRWLRRP